MRAFKHLLFCMIAGWAAFASAAPREDAKNFPEGALRMHVDDWRAKGSSSLKAYVEAIQHQAAFGRAVTSDNHTVNVNTKAAQAYVLRRVGRRAGVAQYSLLVVCEAHGRRRAVEFQGDEALFKNNASNSMGYMRSYSDAACKEAPRAQTPTAQERPPAAPPEAAGVISQVLAEADSLWHVGAMVPTIDGYQARQYSVLALSDGTATSRVESTLKIGVAASRKKYRGSWGVWRLNSKRELSVRWGSDAKHRDFYFAFKLKPQKRGARVSGCFTARRVKAVTGIGVNSFSAKVDTWCFNKQGRFSNKFTAGLSSSSSGVSASGGSSGATSGSYTFDGYLLSLRYDNGDAVQFLAGISDDRLGERDLLLGGSHFNEQKR